MGKPSKAKIKGGFEKKNIHKARPQVLRKLFKKR